MARRRATGHRPIIAQPPERPWVDHRSAPPSPTRMAFRTTKDVAGDLASDYIAPEQQKSLVFFLLGALSMLAFVVLVRLVQDK